jgi:aspartate kinase
VVAGFQGVDEDGNITTLGRGGSDTTAVALAAALKADVCEIYTDVDGVYTADPNVVPTARKIDRISYEEMLELSSLGAKVLQLRSVEFGMNYRVPIHVRTSFSNAEGTWVVSEEAFMEQVVVTGVTVARDEAKITVRNLPDTPGTAYKLLAPLADAGIVVDMIIQNTSVHNRTDMTFTVPRGDRRRATELLNEKCPDLTDGGKGVAWDDGIAKISVVGVGMRSHAGVARRMFELLASENVNIQMISTSEIKISAVVDEKYAELAMRTLHDGFGLHLAPDQRAQL